MAAMPSYGIKSFPYPGGGAFANALNYYRQQLGPQGEQAGNLAAAQATDTSAGDYYSTPTGTDPSQGAAAANAQGAFGKLLTGQAAANNAAAATNAQTRSQAGSGVLAANQGYANDIASNIQAQMALNEATGRQGAQNAGMLSGLIGSFTSPGGAGSNIINAIPGVGDPSNAAKSSGLGDVLSGGKGLLSSLTGSLSSAFPGLGLSGSIPATGAIAGAADTSGLAGFGSILDMLGPAALVAA